MRNLPYLASNRSAVSGKTVLVRVGINAPLEDGAIAEDVRLRALLPTLNFLVKTADTVIVCGHISGNDNNSVRPAADWLRDHFSVDFVSDFADGVAEDQIKQSDAELVLFENLRQYPDEKANNQAFAEMLAGYADVYVNEAFPAAHRGHASVVSVPQFLPAYAGLQFEKEVKNLSRVLNPERPFTFILGGVKFSTKLPLVEKFATRSDNLFLAGALLNAYLQAGGYDVGSSRVPDKQFALSAHEKTSVHLPDTVVVETAAGSAKKKPVDNIAQDDVIVDLSPESVTKMQKEVDDSVLTVWNGPLGWYEKGFTDATDQLADALAATDKDTILGGGDTATVIFDDHNPEDFSFVSTAGGAMIEFLAEETLPAIEAL
jgi:phosphoglycerate kinase